MPKPPPLLLSLALAAAAAGGLFACSLLDGGGGGGSSGGDAQGAVAIRPTITATATSAETGATPGVYYGGGSVAPVTASGKTVLVVLAAEGFHYGEYARTRVALQAAGHAVHAASPTGVAAVPAPGTGGTTVIPETGLTRVETEDYDALLLIGGWGAATLGGAFPGVAVDAAHRIHDAHAARFDEVLAALASKPLGAIGYGVAALAWARVDGRSVLFGRRTALPREGSPAVTVDGRAYADGELPASWHLTQNGATAVETIGNPASLADDVLSADGVVTASGVDAAEALAAALDELLRAP